MSGNQEYQNLQETKVHSDVYFPYNTYLCTIPLDFKHISPHWHEDVEIIVIKKGQGIVNVDTRSYYVNAGDLIVVRPGQIHSIYQESEYTMEYENIIFQSKILYTSVTDLCTIQFFELYLSLKYDFMVHIHETVPNSQALNECIGKIDEYCNKKTANYQMMVKSYLHQFFFIYAQGQEQLVESTQGKHLGKMKEVLSFLEKNYMDDITVESVAKEFGFSYSHFLKVFKQNMHVTFTSYLNDYRLNKAAELLVATEDNIVEIMEKVGFNNLSYFNRIFKECYKMTPREYRKDSKR